MIMDLFSNCLFRWFAVACVFLSLSGGVCAQSKKTEHTLGINSEKDEKSNGDNKLDLSSLDWLVGRWVGTGLGGECEEVFLPPWNGSMTGTFRFASEGKVVFSEFFSLIQKEDGAVLRLKHFHPDMKSWEEKDDTTNFELIRIDKHTIWFDGLTYHLEDNNKLNVWVAMKNTATGELSEASFVFHRSMPEQNEPQVVVEMNRTQSNTTERVLRKEIIVNCSRESAFEMWTTAAGVAKFFSPDCLIELHPGGAYEMYFGLEPDESGRRGSQGSKVVSLLPNEFFIFDWSFPPSTPELRRTEAKTHVMVAFEAIDDRHCRVRLTQYGWKTGEEWDKGYSYFDRVWPMVLEQFQDACNENP
jgi:uncharacterized protein YndB with AHSA1/START domain